MSKKDYRENYPDKIFLAPKEDIVRYHASSGTTGKPTIVGYTRKDIDNWSESLARSITSAGLGKHDVVQVANTYGLFTGGLGFHYAAERIGAAVVPASTGNTERQVELIQDLGVTAMACTPSYMIHVGEVAEKMGVSLKNDTKLRYGLLGCRALVGQDEGQDLRFIGRQGHQLLRRQRALRTALERVRAPAGDPRLGGHGASGDNRSEDQGTGRPGREGGDGAHHAPEGGVPADPLPHRRPDGHGRRGLRLRKGASAHHPHHRPGGRYAHYPGDQCLPVPGGVFAQHQPRSGERVPDRGRAQGCAWTR